MSLPSQGSDVADMLVTALSGIPCGKWKKEPKMKTPIRNEATLMREVVSYLELRGLLYCHVPNEAVRHKCAGTKAGVPDLLIFERWAAEYSHGFGLAIELKTAVGKVSPGQHAWLDGLEERGWLVGVCRSFEAAQALIDKAVKR